MSDQDIVKNILTNLRENVQKRNLGKCLELIGIVIEYFDGSLNTSQINYAVELLLKWDDHKINILRFLAKSLSISKSDKFSEANKRVFELLQLLINHYPATVKPFSKDVIGFCVIYMKSNVVTAFEKELAVRTIHSMILKDCLHDEVDKSSLIADVMSVFDQKSPTTRLQQHIFELLGNLSKAQPDKFAPSKAVELRNKMMDTIQSLFKDDKVTSSLALIGGAVEGLKNHLVNFTPTLDEDPTFIEKLYECMVQLSDPEKLPSSASSNRVAFRNMLQIIQQYGSLHNIPALMFRDYKFWQKVLLKWIDSKTYEDKNSGVHAIQSFHKQVAEVLEERQNQDDKRVLMFFMTFFQETLESPKSQPHEIRIAIRGFGLMAPACKLLLEPKYLSERFDLVMQRTEYSYHTNDRIKRREVLEHLPNYVEALSRIMNQLEEISGMQLQSLESIVVILIKDYHYLSTSHQFLVPISLLETFINFQKLGGNVLESVLESVIWKGILWTCSHQLVYDMQENLDNVKDWKENITYKRYLPLWKHLLKPSDEKHEGISKLIYNHFIKDLFMIIEKLDLSTQKRKYYDASMDTDKEFFFSDPSLDLEPVRAENFQILYNLVQFYSDVLAQQSVECLKSNFIEWLEFWLEKSTQLSMKHPLISGFLQLIEISLKVMDRLDYASEIENREVERVIGFCIKSMLLVRCQQTSGELQIACLNLVFQVPTAILKGYDSELTPVLILGFSVGRSLLSVAHHALTCFERVVDSLAENPKPRRRLLEQVLPSLETYLSSRDSAETELKKFSRVKKQRLAIIATETDLMRFKKRVLLFLGNFDPEEAQLVLSCFEQKLVRDHITEVFGIRLECSEKVVPLIFLDNTVERICQLAVSSSERSTKISACELLHGLVVYMMGKNLDGAETLSLWKDLCRNLIILGADKDQTVRQLFEPLLMQMMHFYSQPKNILSPMATALIESLLAMICFRGNNSVQDLSARLLREFILWLNKVTDRNQRMASPVKLVDLFQEMKKMSLETDAYRRMGATLAFNNIYRIIREDESLIDVYWLYLLDVFGTNFKSSEDFSSEFDNNFIDSRRFEQVSSTLDHLTRVFVERSDVFHRSNTDRIRPCGFEGITLIEVLKWLFNESGRPEYHYRHKCMEMFMKILPECGSINEVFDQTLCLEKILKVGEANGIAQHPDLKHLKDCQEPIFKEISKWMQTLLISLDFYIWIFENQIIEESKTAEFLQRSVVLSTISFFLGSIVNKDMQYLLRSINENLLTKSQISFEAKMGNRNLDNIDTIRCIILVRIIDFLTILINKNLVEQFLDANKIELIKITKKLLFKPQRLGFDFKSKNSLMKLTTRLTSFVNSVYLQAPVEFKKPFLNLLKNKLIKHLNNLCEKCDQLMTEKAVGSLNTNKLKGIDLVISNMKDFFELDILEEELIHKTAEALLVKIFNGITEVAVGIHRPRYLNQSAKAFATGIVKLCLKVDSFLRKIVTFSFNDTILQISSSSNIKQGEHFLQIFKQPIFELFTSILPETIQLLVGELKETTDSNKLRILAILTELNEHIFNYHRDNQELLELNISTMVAQWPAIIRSALEMENDLNCVDLAIINLVTHLAMASPIDHIELGRRLEKFQQWLLAFLENSKNSLELKSKAVILLPCITDSNDKANEKLMKALNSIQEKHMPLKSHEFPDGSLKRVGLVAITEALFVALLRSRSPVIYRFIINATISDDDYILESKLHKVQMELMESLSPSEQEFLMNQTFDAFSSGGFEPEFRLKFISRFLLTIMKTCRVDVMMSFFRQKIDVIWNLTEAALSDDSENALVNRCGGYMIIEAFVATVPKEKIENGIYSYAGQSNSGVNMIKDFIKKMNKVRSELVFVVEDPVRQNLLRMFHCYCYRALAAMISNIKDNPELYNLTLFKEDPDKNTFIWRKLINVTNDELYSNWSQDFQEFPRLKNYIVSVKDLQGSNKATNRKYIETVSIFDRSLSQSLTKTDLSYSVVLSKRESLQREQERRELEHQKAMKIELESTPINDHEVMSVLVGVVRHIYQRKISPSTDLERHERKKYEWVLSIASSMSNSNNHKNVRIFLAKLIDNCRDVFVHYAKQLLGAVLSVIVDGCLGDKMNFFITDLVTMVLSWSHIYKPSSMSEKQDACALLKFLMENANNERDEIFKLNLELIKKMVEIWKDVLAEKIPTQTLLDLLQKPFEQEMNQKLRCGIQLNAVVLANDLEPWSNSEQRNLFINAIVGCFSSSNAHVYQAAAQLLGMCLHKMVGEADIVEGDENFQIIDEITQKLTRIRTKNNDINVFLQLLYGIQKSFPRILDPFMTLIKFNIPKAVRRIKCIYLEMFLSRLEVDAANLYPELVTIGVKDLLRQNEYQMLALHIINKSLEHLKADSTQAIVDELVYLAGSTRVEVRQILIEMMIFVVKKHQDDETFSKKNPMRIILKGFTDADPQIQNRAGSFFSSEGGLSKSFFKRFEELLSNYYDPTLEKEFLHYATQLLLDISIREPRSKIPLLNYDATKDKEYFEYPITTKSYTQRSLPPMFIQSQQRQLLTGDGSIYDQIVRATQLSNDTRIFTPTQDPIKMTQISQTFAFKETQNSLFFSLKPQFLDKRSNTFKQPELDEFDIETQIARKKEGTKPGALDYLRQRIVRKDAQEKSREYANRAIDRRNYSEAKREEKIKQSKDGREVVLYRRYRLGDLPDFFFNSLAILMPLQALAKKDVAVARDVFISIFQSIVEILSKSDEDAEKLFYVSINKAVMSILQQTKNSDTFFLGTLIEMAMKSKKYLEISPNILVNVSTMNNMMVTGALFLESQLKHLLVKNEEGEEEEPSVKRQKFDTDETKLNHWSKLIELYYKLNEYEVVIGLFTEKLNLVPAVKQKLTTAIDFEAAGEFSDASLIYQDLIRKGEARNRNEKEFYYQSFFFCLENLSDWREITKEIRLQFDSYNEVWDEAIPFHKETLLPHLLKSELRMILNENQNDEFLGILEEWINNKEKCEYLRDVFPEEIVMIRILEEKFAEGCVEAETALRNFGDEWSCIEMQDEKLKCLKSARNLAELSNFISLMTAPSMEKRLEKMYLNWKLSHPKPTDSLVHWGDLIAYRQNFNKLLPVEDDRSSSYLVEIKQKLFNVAFAQKNCDAARFMINELRDDIMANPSAENLAEKTSKCKLATAKYNMMVVEQKLLSPVQKVEKLCSGLEKINNGVIKKAGSKKFPTLYTESFCCASEISWQLWNLFREFQAEGNAVPGDWLNAIAQHIEAPEGDSDVSRNLLKYSEESLKKAKKFAQKCLDESYSAESELLLADVFLKTGQFYHQVYTSGAVTSQEIQWKMIQSIFRAIAYGSTEAKIYIPYILQLSDLKNNQLTSQFNTELNMVPTYMFIPYISQMLSSYDFEEVCYLDELLLKVATKYPGAVFFPFKLSRTNYQQRTENRGMEKEHVMKVDDVISSPIMNQFSKALQCLVVPEKLLFAHFCNFKYFVDSNRSTMTDEKFKEAVQKLQEEVFMKNRDLKGSSFTTIKDFREKFHQLEKSSWAEDKKYILSRIRSLYMEVNTLANRRYESFELHRLCNWLAEYKWSGENDFIEIPGQYSGDVKPFVEQHVKIVRFEQRLKVFSSKQLPIEIKMYGSDGKTYSFIIKYGEDLRQDQRIQQVLELMSKELANDKNCKQNHLQIQTYQVIPINSNCGMLSVVKDATTISEFLQVASKHSMNTPFIECLQNIRQQYREHLLGDELFVDWGQTYGTAILTRTGQQLADGLIAKEALIPKDIFSEALMKSAVSLETFYILRKNFITSLATMSIAHWLLGIGDRHLNNILMDVKSGRLIGIDFGIAFGAAANIAVPETVPFRLTHHFENVIAPLGTDGMIRKNMIHAMRCLRKFREKILICLEMFVNEPTMDWLIRAKLMNVGDDKDNEADFSWNPKARIAIVKRKLNGANPVKIIQDELSISQVADNPELLARYKVLTDGEGESERKKMKSEDLSVEDQVTCLVEMATDKTLLATIYIGWDPWF